MGWGSAGKGRVRKGRVRKGRVDKKKGEAPKHLSSGHQPRRLRMWSISQAIQKSAVSIRTSPLKSIGSCACGKCVQEHSQQSGCQAFKTHHQQRNSCSLGPAFPHSHGSTGPQSAPFEPDTQKDQRTEASLKKRTKRPDVCAANLQENEEVRARSEAQQNSAEDWAVQLSEWWTESSSKNWIHQRAPPPDNCKATVPDRLRKSCSPVHFR